MMMRSCKDHRPARTCLAAFTAAVLALSTLAPQSIAYAVEVAQNMAAGGGRALVVVEEGFDAASFSQAGLASTGDGAGCPLVVAAVLALVSACAVGTALRRARTSSSDRLPRSPER